MNYDDLRRYHRLEKTGPKLAELSNDFEVQLADLIKNNKDSYSGSGNTTDLKMLENILKIARDLYDRREQKMIMKSLADSRTNTHELKNLLSEEQDLYVQMKQLLKGKRTAFDEVLAGKAPRKIKNSKVLDEKLGTQVIEAKNPQKEAEDLNTVLVRTIKKLPKFVSSDLKEFGPFDEKQVISIPKKEADLLSKRGFIELI